MNIAGRHFGVKALFWGLFVLSAVFTVISLFIDGYGMKIWGITLMVLSFIGLAIVDRVLNKKITGDSVVAGKSADTIDKEIETGTALKKSYEIKPEEDYSN